MLNISYIRSNKRINKSDFLLFLERLRDKSKTRYPSEAGCFTTHSVYVVTNEVGYCATSSDPLIIGQT